MGWILPVRKVARLANKAMAAFGWGAVVYLASYVLLMDRTTGAYDAENDTCHESRFRMAGFVRVPGPPSFHVPKAGWLNRFYAPLDRAFHPRPLSREVASRKLPPQADGLRLWMTFTKFKHFQFSGTVSAALEKLMLESKSVSPDGRMMGGFVFSEPELGAKRVTIDVTNMDALHLVDELCRQIGGTWTLEGPIVIRPAVPIHSSDGSAGDSDPFRAAE